ncbi:MAG: NADH-quinone oxidoreductase subunit C [Cyclobacteriaceae bacterium]|nr:NADH-quinone oxidoreductase subunit C [Cyclobacteriaceae bacterium]
MNKKYNTSGRLTSIKNQQKISLKDIPVLEYEVFYQEVVQILEDVNNHCLSYYAFPFDNKLKFICAISADEEKEILLLSHELEKPDLPLKSIAGQHLAMHIFEREIHENHGVPFEGHPWLKPVRYAFNRKDRKKMINNYPFYKIGGNELHEVGVGPIHAGVIEPGHFRFLCNGETVLHLEIQLGWQHRGVEALFLEKKKLLQRNLLAESIAGDTAIGHNLAFCQLAEALGDITVDKNLEIERVIALELERMAIHTGDLSAFCTDVAYQLGSAVFGALRTPLINFTQAWSGNRFGKGLIRVGGTNYPLTQELQQKLKGILNDFEKKFTEIAERTFNLPSVLKRFESIGAVSTRQVSLLGGVGMVAKMAGLKRDSRYGQPFGAYRDLKHEPVLLGSGDVYARGMVRKLEVEQSLVIIRNLMEKLNARVAPTQPVPAANLKWAGESIAVSVTEGWRGEVCHIAVTDKQGEISHYKVKDPSMHNWKSLELSLRDLEISDFPINNKSYDLSYCGHDL